MDTCAALTRRVEYLEFDKVAQALEVTKLERRVKKLEKRHKVRVLKLKRLQKVETSHRVETSNDTVMDDESNQGRMIAEMDQDNVVVLEDDKDKDRKVADTVKDVEEAKVDESVQDQGRQAEFQAEIYKIDMDHANKVLGMQEDKTEPAEPMQLLLLLKLKFLLLQLLLLRVGKGFSGVETPLFEGMLVEQQVDEKGDADEHVEEVNTGDAAEGDDSAAHGEVLTVQQTPPQSPQAEIYKIDMDHANKVLGMQEDETKPAEDEAIDHVKRKAKEDPGVKKYQPMKRKPQTKAQARKNIMMYLKNVAGFKLDYFKGISYDDIRLIFEAKFNSNRAAKMRKLDEEVEELKRHLQIMPNKDDDVYTEATPLAREVPVVDYEIIEINNKPYYKIIRVDGTHQLYKSFLTLLRN
nr:hypothetical protein [Tanacetum cinerariifolium]